MRDQMDEYIGRSLKNWATEQKPPAGVREDLMNKILSEMNQDSHKKSRLHSFLAIFSVTRAEYPPFSDLPYYPVTQSRMWTLQLAHSLRCIA